MTDRRRKIRGWALIAAFVLCVLAAIQSFSATVTAMVNEEYWASLGFAVAAMVFAGAAWRLSWEDR